MTEDEVSTELLPKQQILMWNENTCCLQAPNTIQPKPHS